MTKVTGAENTGGTSISRFLSNFQQKIMMFNSDTTAFKGSARKGIPASPDQFLGASLKAGLIGKDFNKTETIRKQTILIDS